MAKGRLELDRDVLVWIKQALALRAARLIPLSPEIAVAAAQLGDGFPGDPADRTIVASALQLRTELVTKDGRLRSAPVVRTVW